jgi:hypothetical protein
VRKILSLVVALVATLALASTALGAITFHSGPTLTWNGDGSATASGDLSGLGNSPATATLQITTSYTYTCQNHGGNVAPGQNSVEVFGAPGTQPLDNTDHNGRATLLVTAYPGTPQATVGGKAAGCPNGKWTGINPVQTGAATAVLTITQGAKTIYSATFTYPSTVPNA